MATLENQGFLLEAGSQAPAPVYYEQSFEKKISTSMKY